MISIEKIKPIHPFPARMAPEIAFQVLNGLSKKSIVLDPMIGSGTVMRTISELGYKGIGFDIDPLAVLMAKAWTSKIDDKRFLKQSEKIVAVSENHRMMDLYLPWIDDDMDTKKFIDFWFAPSQIKALRKLSYTIKNSRHEYADIYKVALSRLIITKTKGASLAADVSHSRPHKVRETNNFDVLKEFDKSCHRIVQTLTSEKLKGKVSVQKGDARNLVSVKSNSVDSIITSPPYLNALDYMRGHKLSLVWLGHRLGALANIRGTSVGAEKAPDRNSEIAQVQKVLEKMKGFESLPERIKNMTYRYAFDMENILKESSRVLKENKNATFVIGNSNLKGVYIDNTLIAEAAAAQFGLKVVERIERKIPENKRYLPPPKSSDKKGLNGRMRTETILTFKKAK